jgi:hypothetical protein
MTDQRPDRAEQPRAEPEIIPPDRDGRSSTRRESAVWIQMGPQGVHRVQFGRPSLLSLFWLALFIAFLVAFVFVVLFGAVLIFIPVVILLLVAAFGAGLWQRFFPRAR